MSATSVSFSLLTGTEKWNMALDALAKPFAFFSAPSVQPALASSSGDATAALVHANTLSSTPAAVKEKIAPSVK